MRRGAGRAARLIASGGFIGFAPAAPGTVASAVACAAGLLILRAGGRPALGASALAATLAGLAVLSGRPEAETDPGWVVVDEIAGQWLAMGWMTRPSLGGAAASFAAFRTLDILKPGPIGAIDRRRGAAGVMFDDVLAGICAGAGLALARALVRRRD